jgi:hypothetical protein
MRHRPRVPVLALVLAALAGCSKTEEPLDSGNDRGASGESSTGASGTPGEGSGATGGTSGTTASGGSSGKPPVIIPPNQGGAGSEDECKSLRIATIGRLGPWGASTLFTQWLMKEGTAPAVDLGDTVLTDEVLSKFDVIVALNLATFPIDEQGDELESGVSHEYSAAEASALESWVRAGGGVMSTIGYTYDEAGEQANIDRLLQFAKMGYSTTKLDAAGEITDFDPHPTTTNVAKLSIDNGVSTEGSGGTVIGRDDYGNDVLLVGDIDKGHVVVWADEWITYDEYWGDRPDLDIERFWVNVMNYLAPGTACELPILK